MNTGMKIGLASAFGATSGGMVAWYAHHTWWAVLLGLLVGALVGYLSYEWKTIITNGKGIVWDQIESLGIEKKWGVNWTLIGKTLGAGIIFSSIGLWVALVIILGLISLPHQLHVNSIGYNMLVPTAIHGATFMGAVGILSGFLKEGEAINWTVVIWLNPILFPFTVSFLLLLGFCKVFRKIFVAIHCEERVQSAFYATVGVAVGHFASHSFAGILVGAVAGFALGSVSYKLISVRLLKPTVAT